MTLTVGTIVTGVIILLAIVLIAMGYVKASPDKAYIISGLRKEPKVLIGRAGIKIPFLEKKDELILKQISIDIKTNGYIPTKDFIGVDIDAVAKVRVLTEKDVTVDKNGELIPGCDPNKRVTHEMAQAAMKNFLNMNEAKIREALTDSLQGNMREIIGTQFLKELCNDRKTFGDEVQAKAQKDMNALGIWIESCNIQKIEDENNLITALGQDNMSQIQKDASVAKAQADRDVAIAKAQAEKDANDARVIAETEIAQKQTDLAIKKAELKKQSDIKQAEADAAYEIQNQEQRKTIEIVSANANIAKQEREIELKKKEAEVTEQALDAEIKKKAEADKFARQQAAEAELIERQRQAEAEAYEKQKAAEASLIQTQKASEAKKIEAEANMYAKTQEAEGIKRVGEAEAEAIRAKGVAEAEATEKKAEAMKKYGQAAMVEMIVKVLPDMAKAVAEPLAAIDKVTIIDSGDGNTGVGSMGGYVPQVLAKTIESIKETTGFDIAEVMKAETYDAKVNKNINFTGIPDGCDINVDVASQTVKPEKKKVKQNTTDEDTISDK